jgi:ABC-type lipoprotein export system ATPase subunit
MLSSSKVKFSYPKGPEFAFPDISCGQSQHMLIIGESGKGKTTLLHLLAGMLRPLSGSILIDGKDISEMPDPALDRYRGEKVGMVFQTAHFVQSLSVEDNLLLPQFLAGVTVDKEKVRSLVERLGLVSKLNVKPGKLSVGEQQRLAIVRAVMNNPAVIFADEPTSALDDKNANEVISLLEEQAAVSKASLIIVTHDKRLKDRFPKQVVL